MDTSSLGLLVLPLPLLVLIAAAEGWLRQRRGLGHDWKAYWASLGDAAGRVLINGLLGAGIIGALLYAVWPWRIATFTMDRWWHWALLFVGQEFCYYWMHRADHRIHWFWLNHSVHHSSNQYTLSSAYRLGWTGKITGATIFFAPLVWLGFPVPVVLAALAVNLLYQFWLHTELIGRLPRPIEFVFNTPSHHRVHHASNPDYIDCNYGGVLIVFDRMFGSFRREREDEPPRYGLVKPIYSHNPVRIAFHTWLQMFRTMKSARTWKERAVVLFGPPQ
ncbi:sterol desaturase family protein [Luteibacter sp. UNCMF366Tsu5.1]|uniref:sterol desaturase family protein n=1 Tax=Luteibacter sp. UNCMF366Tsu5.1 TaxID=1502758 RepID=UPI000908EE45|nr:sterol desaturase family protein [Luteibacter sp. UNCMF366Tsu5.1]SFW33596.1 Sterol desaturase/sphingolipid hydroxylase, fatty acid hydroxylase superfamily [Luteibacter sp. UNCMF366Tsu5.1]